MPLRCVVIILSNKFSLLRSLPYYLLVVIIISSTPIFAQKKGEIKFGKVSAEDRALMTAPGVDSAAEAYVLYDILDLEINENPEGRPYMKEFRHRRLKLLTEASFDRADIEIVYNRESERVFAVNAMIHLPDGESKKLSKSEIIRERYDDDRDILKFTFPGVQVGAIIEYSYAKNDDYITVPARYFFQESIPVRLAEYRAMIPFMFNYLSLANSALQYDINERATLDRRYGSNQIRHTYLRWGMKDIPAYTDQPYVNNFQDYIPQVRMQLQSVAYPGQAVQSVFSDWKTTTKKMSEWNDFGKMYRNKGNSNKVWKVASPKLSGMNTEVEKAQVLYDFVAGKISWDGSYRWIAEKTPNKTFDAAEGSSGEASLLLLALLRQAGIEAQPLLVPLRNGGSPIELYPILSQFDHVMVLATLDGKPTILDPGSIRRPMGLPRVSALNHRAFVADPDDPRWVDVTVPKAVQTVMASMVIDETGTAEVDVQSRLSSYFGFRGREMLDEMESDNEMPLVDEVVEMFPAAELISHELLEEEEESGPLSLPLKMKIPLGEAIDDYLYVQPVICPVLEKGLADVEERLYPVDFAYPWQQRYIASITLPEGFVVDELPESKRVTSEDGTINCTFAVQEKGANEIAINFTVNVARTVYKPNEYAALKQIFKMIIDFQETTLVLKRAK